MKQQKWVVGLLLVVMQVMLAAASPISMLEQTAGQLLGELKKHQAELKGNPGVVDEIINRVLLPKVDIETMARAALGRDGWSSADPNLRSRFIKAFTTLVSRTYGSALAEYSDETIKFLPLRGEIGSGQQRIEVQSLIVRTDGPSIPVNYRLLLENEAWKVYDFSVEGVSMVGSFRAQFGEQLAAGTSVATLIDNLERHNQRKPE